MKKILFFSFILFCVVACGQKHKQNIEAIKQQVKQQISQYQSFPNYSIQVNKGVVEWILLVMECLYILSLR